MAPLFAFGNPLMLLVLGAIAVMLFGERLPEVARSFGKGLMELKNGMRELQNEIQNAVEGAGSLDAPAYAKEPEDREEATAPKFEPPPSS